MARIAFARGWVVVSTGANIAGNTLGLAQFAWTVAAALLVPYAAFWLWLLTTYEVFVRRTPSAGR
jgi:fucose 4-O-acetylase-like acetyltransferase